MPRGSWGRRPQSGRETAEAAPAPSQGRRPDDPPGPTAGGQATLFASRGRPGRTCAPGGPPCSTWPSVSSLVRGRWSLFPAAPAPAPRDGGCWPTAEAGLGGPAHGGLRPTPAPPRHPPEQHALLRRQGPGQGRGRLARPGGRAHLDAVQQPAHAPVRVGLHVAQHVGGHTGHVGDVLVLLLCGARERHVRYPGHRDAGADRAGRHLSGDHFGCSSRGPTRGPARTEESPKTPCHRVPAVRPRTAAPPPARPETPGSSPAPLPPHRFPALSSSTSSDADN